MCIRHSRNYTASQAPKISRKAANFPRRAARTVPPHKHAAAQDSEELEQACASHRASRSTGCRSGGHGLVQSAPFDASSHVLHRPQGGAAVEPGWPPHARYCRPRCPYCRDPQFLEEKTKFYVVGGLMSPAHDVLVRSINRRAPSQAIPAVHRVAMCELLGGT